MPVEICMCSQLRFSDTHVQNLKTLSIKPSLKIHFKHKSSASLSSWRTELTQTAGSGRQ